MIRMASGFRRAVILFAGAFFCGATTFGANGTWTGAQDALWTNSANWSASPFAGQAINETAVFCNAGNGNTLLDVAGLNGLFSIIFDTPDVASYTIGAGAPNSQTLVLANGGTFQLAANAAASQSFNAAVQLGHATNNASFAFRNDNPGQTLAFNKVLVPAASVANALRRAKLYAEAAGAQVGEIVQIQEDGLPTVLFGDIQFGNNDYWTRFDASVERVESGARQVEQARQSIQHIVDQVQRVAVLINEINNASVEQAEGVAQIGQAVAQLDQSTQQNAALVEESAAAAESLHGQALRLGEALAVYQVSAAPAPPQRSQAHSARAALHPPPTRKPPARAIGAPGLSHSA